MNYIKELKVTDWVSMILSSIMFLTILYLVFIVSIILRLIMDWLKQDGEEEKHHGTV